MWEVWKMQCKILEKKLRLFTGFQGPKYNYINQEKLLWNFPFHFNNYCASMATLIEHYKGSKMFPVQMNSTLSVLEHFYDACYYSNIFASFLGIGLILMSWHIWGLNHREEWRGVFLPWSWVSTGFSSFFFFLLPNIVQLFPKANWCFLFEHVVDQNLLADRSIPRSPNPNTEIYTAMTSYMCIVQYSR